MKTNRKMVRQLSRIIFVIYLLILIYFLFFAEQLGRTGAYTQYAYNLVLFKEIRRFLTHQKQLGFEAVFLNVYGNILIFMPFGFFLPIIWRRLNTFLTVSILTLFFSLLIEVVQLFSRVGSFDVDDLLLNTIGGMLGFVLYRIAQPKVRKYFNGSDQEK